MVNMKGLDTSKKLAQMWGFVVERVKKSIIFTTQNYIQDILIP